MSIHKIKKKSGFKYKAVICLPRGKQKSKTFDRKIDAENWQAKCINDKAIGKNDIQRTDLTFEAFALSWLDRHSINLEVSTKYRYGSYMRNQIFPTIGNVKLQDLSLETIESWKKEIAEDGKWKPKTINDSLALLKKILDDAVASNLLSFNPAKRVRKLQRQSNEMLFWNQDEVIKFLMFAVRISPKWFPFYVLALNSGMRLGEIAALKWDAVDLTRKQITVKRTFCSITGEIKESTKSKKVRYIPVNARLEGVLKELKLSADPNEGRVFVGYNYDKASKILGKLCKRAEVKKIRFHDLRHTFASIYMMNGGSIYDLQRILGHSSITITERYSHLSPTHLNGKTDIINFELLPEGKVLILNLD